MSKLPVWKELAGTACFWLEIPTSSIAAERAFAIMRLIDNSLRSRLTEESVQRELFFRVNSTVVDSMLNDHISVIRSIV